MEQYFARDYRRIASERCASQTGRLILITLIYLLITGAISAISRIGYVDPVYDANGVLVTAAQVNPIASSVSSILSFLATTGLLFSWIFVNKKLARNEEVKAGDIIEGFKTNYITKLLLEFLMGLFIFLWSLLLVIPGIIKAFAYSMAPYILDDNPEMDANDAITQSKELMDGHKWELFCLEFSYIGWVLLSILTCGILLLWVIPKMEAAVYAFYQHISGQDEVVVEEATEEVA